MDADGVGTEVDVVEGDGEEVDIWVMIGGKEEMLCRVDLLVLDRRVVRGV